MLVERWSRAGLHRLDKKILLTTAWCGCCRREMASVNRDGGPFGCLVKQSKDWLNLYSCDDVGREFAGIAFAFV